MATKEDEKTEELRRRVARLELLATLAFLPSGDELDDKTRFFISRYLQDAYQSANFLHVPDYEFLINRLAYSKFQSRSPNLAEQISALQNDKSQLEERLKSVSAALTNRIDSAVEDMLLLRETCRTLSADTHQWLALQSLGISDAETKMARFLPLRVYLSDTPEGAVENVTQAVGRILDAFGFELADEFPAILGSWWKKWFARGQELMSQPEVAQRLEQIERALQLKGLGQPQADIDAKQAGAVAQLMTALANVPNAALQVGSILLIKLTSDSGPTIHVRTLTQQELILLENNQKLLASPTDLLERLSEICESKQTPTNSPDVRDAKRRRMKSNGKGDRLDRKVVGFSSPSVPQETSDDHKKSPLTRQLLPPPKG